MVLFGIIAWIFLFFSERVFGLIARRFSSTRLTDDPMETVIRSTKPSGDLYKWDREKDRLVSEYIRCMNETSYVKQMAKNCLYLRVWFRPMFHHSSIETRIAVITEPIVGLGQPRGEIQVELVTTLQVFIRIGNDSSQHKIDKIQLIETYSKFQSEHSDMMIKFAVVDWSRESLYKILLHGHYNVKSAATD